MYCWETGAPLVPIGDRILFAEYDYCMNLGGFSNVSFEEKEIESPLIFHQ
jgi:1,6-anhydro-N-acetylmuramate kinase